MKNLIFTILILFLTIFVKAQSIDSLQKANEYYASDEIGKAVLLYENIIEEGYESAALYFNLGNAYYKNGDISNAILNYERAKLFSPTDEDIQFNLELLNQFVVDKIEPLPRPFFIKWGDSILNLFSTDGWAYISIVCFILVLVFGIIYFFTTSIGIKKFAFSITLVLIVFSVLTFVFANKQKTKITNRNHAIIFNPTVTVKASPDDSGTDLFVIHEGLKVEITDQVNSWMEIKLEDGNSGWIKNNVLERI